MDYQIDLFSGEPKDNRTRKQKRTAKKSTGPAQLEMFSQREVAQFGVKARPKIDISPKTRLELALIDIRTEEEKQRAIDDLNFKLDL